MKKRFTKPAPFWMSWGSAKKSFQTALPLSVLDGPGVFETLRVYGGRIAHADAHVRRLRASAQTSGIACPPKKKLLERLTEALRRSGLSDAIARLSLHVSGSNPRSVWTGCSVRPFAGCPEEWLRSGLRIRTASVRRPGPSASPAQVKGNDYVNALGAILNASADTDLLMLSASGFVAETTIANLLLLRQGALWTPPAACGILLGVTRAAVLEAAQNAGLRVLEKPFTRHDLYNADEVFVTNAAVEVLSVVEADARRIGNGRPGPWARRLRDAYRKRALPDFS